MTTTEWIEERIARLLSERIDVLDSWRSQRPTKQGRPKNFENWFLVELIHTLVHHDGVTEIRTNGHFDNSGLKYKSRDVASGLKGAKRLSSSLSPDVTFRIPTSGERLLLEIKTGTSSQEVLDDLRIVAFHNDKQRDVRFAGCATWIVLEPADSVFAKRVSKSAEHIVRRAAKAGFLINLRCLPDAPWCKFAVEAPGYGA